MNKRILISILIGIVVVFSLVYFNYESKLVDGSVISDIDFIYSDVDKIQKILDAQQIFMSSPTTIIDHTVDQYCMFFDSENVQRFVQSCITTALVDSDGQPLGNFNMGGNPITPIMALAIIEVSSLDSNQDDVAFVFETMIDTLVCDCWEAQKPGGFESISSWLDAAKQQYGESDQNTLKSKINGLAQKQLILEITATEKSYIWTLIVIK